MTDFFIALVIAYEFAFFVFANPGAHQGCTCRAGVCVLFLAILETLSVVGFFSDAVGPFFAHIRTDWSDPLRRYKLGTVKTGRLDLTRFGGHLYTWNNFREEMFTDAEYETTVSC